MADRTRLSIITFVTLLAAVVGGKKPNKNPDLVSFQDVPEALNYMHRYLPDHLSMDEKCKKFAVLASHTATYLNPSEATVYRVVTTEPDELDRQYAEIDTDRLISLLTNVIDRYRVTQLAPAFVDIVNCLRLIDSPAARAFVHNDELVLIVDLYKRILGRDDVEVDIDHINLSLFHPAFKDSLNRLFKGYYHADTRQRPHIIQLKAGVEPGQDAVESSSRPSKRLSAEEVAYRRRERSRLTQRRLRCLHPDTVREQDRKYHEARRSRIKLQEAIILSLPASTAREQQIKDQLQAKRNAEQMRLFEQKNERRRDRYRRQQEHNRVVLQNPEQHEPEFPQNPLIRPQQQAAFPHIPMHAPPVPAWQPEDLSHQTGPSNVTQGFQER